MTSPDLHPEELLDRAASGTISPEEQQRLDHHLAACAVCRFERLARADFAALPDGSMQVEGLVTRALAGLPTLPTPPRRRLVSPTLVAATLVIIGFGSFAAIRLSEPIAALLGISSATPIAPPVPSAVRAIHVQSAAEEAPPREEPAVQEPPSPPPSVISPAEGPTARRARQSSSPPPPAPLQPTAAELFREATAARALGHRAEAEGLYRTLTRTFPESVEARVAHAVLGRLLIDLGRPEEALSEVEAALDGGDATLREDALANRALALEALQLEPAARAAWEQLLREFPASIHARRARQRLEASSDP